MEQNTKLENTHSFQVDNGRFTRMEHKLGHKTIDKYQSIETQSMFSDNKAVKD